MRFEFTPIEAQPVAEAVAVWLTAHGFKVVSERPLTEDAPYRTTLRASKKGLSVLVEAQGTLSYGERIRALCHWLAARRENCELSIATRHDASLTARSITDLKEDGVGLLAPDADGKLHMLHAARNWALIVTPDPTLTYGPYKGRVEQLVETFNDGGRKDALRDMCELVEGLTDMVARIAARKGYVKKTEAEISRLDWHGQIEVLSTPSQAGAGRDPVLRHLQRDLHSFRDGRNLLDHKARNQRERTRRERQFTDRMAMGPRLVAELVSVLNRMKRGR